MFLSSLMIKFTLLSGSVSAYHPAAPGSKPKHNIKVGMLFSICAFEIVTTFVIGL